MPPSDEPGRRHRRPRDPDPDPRWGRTGGSGEEGAPYGEEARGGGSGGRHGAPAETRPRHGAGDRPPAEGPRHAGNGFSGAEPAPWPPPTALPHSPGPPAPRFGAENPGSGSLTFGQAPSPPPGQAPSSHDRPSSPPYGQPLSSPPYGQPPSSGRPPSSTEALPQGGGPGRAPSPPEPGATGSNRYGPHAGWGTGPQGAGHRPNGGGPASGGGPRNASAPSNGAAPSNGGRPANGGGPGSGAFSNGGGRHPDAAAGREAPGAAGPTAAQPTAHADRSPSSARQQPSIPKQQAAADAPLLAGGIPPPAKNDDDGEAQPDARPPGSTGGDAEPPSTTAVGSSGHRRRRGGAPDGPGRDGPEDSTGPGRRARDRNADGGPSGSKKKRKGSFWRELPLLVVVAIVLTFVIQTFIARIYVIPSASMEQTLHGCDGCANDRVAVDKVSYRFSDPAPGDVVVFKGPPAWLDNDEVGDEQPSGNPLVRGLQDALSLVGLAAPNEKDFVKRVIATGGQTVACCDAANKVLVNGKPINEPYLNYQPGFGDKQATFDPVRVPDGQLWVMGDNRNNSADARFHGPVPVSDVIGKVRVVVLPISRWRTVPAIDPQTTTAALGQPAPLGTGSAGVTAGALLAVPLVGAGRRLRHAAGTDTSTGAPPRPGPVAGADTLEPTEAEPTEADRE